MGRLRQLILNVARNVISTLEPAPAQPIERETSDEAFDSQLWWTQLHERWERTNQRAQDADIVMQRDPDGRSFWLDRRTGRRHLELEDISNAGIDERAALAALRLEPPRFENESEEQAEKRRARPRALTTEEAIRAAERIYAEVRAHNPEQPLDAHRDALERLTNEGYHASVINSALNLYRANEAGADVPA